MRRLFIILSLFSLLLFVPVCILWVRSYSKFDHVSYSGLGWSVFAQSGWGQFRFEHTRATLDKTLFDDVGFVLRAGNVYGPMRERMMMPGTHVHLDRWGFWIVTGERWADYHYAVFVPAWFLALFSLLLPAAWLLKHFRLPRAHGRPCPCGYDLRATPERCPECGTEASASAP